MVNELIKYKINPDVVFQPMDDEAIIVSLNSEEIYKLNMTGAEIVKLIEKQTPLREILDLLTKRFDVEDQKVLQEVLELLAQLLKAGLIEEVNSP